MIINVYYNVVIKITFFLTVYWQWQIKCYFHTLQNMITHIPSGFSPITPLIMYFICPFVLKAHAYIMSFSKLGVGEIENFISRYTEKRYCDNYYIAISP